MTEQELKALAEKYNIDDADYFKIINAIYDERVAEYNGRNQIELTTCKIPTKDYGVLTISNASTNFVNYRLPAYRDIPDVIKHTRSIVKRLREHGVKVHGFATLTGQLRKLESAYQEDYANRQALFKALVKGWINQLDLSQTMIKDYQPYDTDITELRDIYCRLQKADRIGTPVEAIEMLTDHLLKLEGELLDLNYPEMSDSTFEKALTAVYLRLRCKPEYLR